MFQTVLIITTTARTSESLREFSPMHAPLCKVLEAILHDSCGGLNHKNSYQQSNSLSKAAAILGPQIILWLSTPAAFCRGFFPLIINSEVCLSMFGATVHALAQGYSCPCEVKVPANYRAVIHLHLEGWPCGGDAFRPLPPCAPWPGLRRGR